MVKKSSAYVIIISVAVVCVLAVAVTAGLTVLSPQSRGKRAVEQAEQYYNNGNYGMAAEKLSKAIELDDADARLWLRKADALYAAGDTKGAAETLSEFLSSNAEYYSGADREAVEKMTQKLAAEGYEDVLAAAAERGGWDIATEEKEDFVISSIIGEINGRAYNSRAARYTVTNDVPTCEYLNVDTGLYDVISGFCEYDGYIYYISSGDGSAGYSTALYRCRTDLSEPELLYDKKYNEVDYEGERDFVIIDNVLYLGGYYGTDQKETVAIELDTMKQTKARIPTAPYTAMGGGHCAEATYKGSALYVEDNSIYIYDGNSSKLVTSIAEDTYIVTIDGAAEGYVYYSYVSGSGMGVLYRVPIEGGEPQYLDEIMPAGGGGPYFCW